MSQPKAILNKLDAYKAECNRAQVIISCPLPPIPKQNLTHQPHSLVLLNTYCLSVFLPLSLAHAGISFLTLCFLRSWFFQRPSSCHSTWNLLQTSLYTTCFRGTPFSVVLNVILSLLLGGRSGACEAPLGSQDLCHRCKGVLRVYIQCPVHAVVSKTLLS